MNTVDHLWQKFSELLLFVLAVLFSIAAYRATYANHIDFANAMLDNNKLVLGALLGLLTKAVMNRSSDNTSTTTNGTINGKPILTPVSENIVQNKTTELN